MWVYFWIPFCFIDLLICVVLPNFPQYLVILSALGSGPSPGRPGSSRAAAVSSPQAAAFF